MTPEYQGRSCCVVSLFGSLHLGQFRSPLNGDGKVDIADLVMLIENWGTSNPHCDIGPMPWGDGKVDEKDLKVLMGYWTQEVNDPRLVAWWRLDEAEGIVAADKVGTNDGTPVGNPTWQPAGGKVGGTLQFDGIDDYVWTPFVMDPAQGPFSIFAWIKGDAPGQVILSAIEGAAWLQAEEALGCLIVDLPQVTTRTKAPLLRSQSVSSAALAVGGDVLAGSCTHRPRGCRPLGNRQLPG